MKCPRCGSDLPKEPTKEWNYRGNYYHVKSYKCPNCTKHTLIYFHNNEFSHTIPKMKNNS